MPELPEVETIARGLRAFLPGRTISAVRCRFPGVIASDPGCFQRVLRGRRVEGVGRHGKYLFLHLQGGRSVAVHLRMTGQVLIQPVHAPPDSHCHLEILFRRCARKLVFRDVRKFGRLQLLEGSIEEFLCARRLGPDALTVRAEELHRRLQGRKRGLKAALLDQSTLAGLGNIYTDELLFRQRLSPLRSCASLRREQVTRLAAGIRALLRQAIGKEGTSISDYVDPRGRAGRFQLTLKVYGRAGSPCPRCGAGIVRRWIAGRGTWSCPRCQS